MKIRPFLFRDDTEEVVFLTINISLLYFLSRYTKEPPLNATAELYYQCFTMSDAPIIKLVLSLIGNDDSKILHLTIGSRKVIPSEKIPKGDEILGNPLLNPCNTVICVTFADLIFLRSSRTSET